MRILLTNDDGINADGYVSVTPLHLDLTHDPSMEALRARFSDVQASG